jgi:hypothetical protein
MNCEKGDLAVCVKSYAGNEGKIVRCLTLVEKVFSEPLGHQLSWITDPLLRNKAGTCVPVPDILLRPIRPQADDAKDETLQWLPVPSRETESA